MDANIAKALNDRLYDKRKSGALELEGLVRESLVAGDHDRIQRIVHQLCHDYAYAVHQPHARNGGLIGLAAASIALGSEVARYLEEIVPPVLACFTDQDARVRYYACESMYNIAKVAKGEILLYFNEVFDALCKLAADSELSVKNGAELLDRLIKDIVSENAASYVSVLQAPPTASNDDSDSGRRVATPPSDVPNAFSLPRFIPLLQERIHVLNPFTRSFLVSWITLLDSIPDLELVSYLPSFLGGLFKFLSDPNQDVHTATQVALERFLAEVKKIARIKRGIAESRKSGGLGDDAPKLSSASVKSERSGGSANTDVVATAPADEAPAASDPSEVNTINDEKSGAGDASAGEDDWIPGQDVQVDHSKILDILVTFLSESSEEEIQLTSLRWIDSFFEICPEDILPFVPRLLSHVLPAMSSDVEQVRQAANRVNTSLMEYIVSLPDEPPRAEPPRAEPAVPQVASTERLQPQLTGEALSRRESVFSTKLRTASRGPAADSRTVATPSPDATPEGTVDEKAGADAGAGDPAQLSMNLDYEAAVNALTLQFLNEHEATRVAALAWLIMLHRKAPRKILAINDGTFPALLKTLSDPAEAVVTRDLLLLSQISRNSDDSYFSSFMVNLLKLFCTDRRLLETRGNLIIRRLCVSLSAERIYRTMADCLEKDEDLEFASIMVQNLNNNLITAPELADLRKRLRSLDSRDGQTFFVTLFRAWCHNAVATFSLCLLAQAYEQAYNLLQIFGELEMTVNMLIQIDKLVQLLESPVFTYLRLQLLEPEKYPHLYKCLYGLLMLLPQSSAFAALKNRLNSVSAIGYLHIAHPGPRAMGSISGASTSSSAVGGSGPGGAGSGASAFERPNRLKARDDSYSAAAANASAIRWADLLDKFKPPPPAASPPTRPASSSAPARPASPRRRAPPPPPSAPRARTPPGPARSASPSKGTLAGNLGRLAGGVGGRKGRK
ncbi:vacuolar protein 14 C-terminal Fig4p binding-domain-containing protein [Lineolata rhizophorae]|uniref:Vacuolar protein 14 C-terminal Fig4p binding-domain-containing protein n=1 Tax=Lineolata rhizophorae TaxID=578093 RepID=A0A6A6NUL9_9PEZI|nr:vacuolar protein 14 C-terminal Fig4p binding-domain-containing protein [Lineolata rhizophorae]